MVVNIFWGVAFALLPFINLFTMAANPNASSDFKLFGNMLSGGNFSRTSRDFALMFIAVGGCVVTRNLRELPVVEKGIFLLIIMVAFVNQLDFLLPHVIFQSFMFSLGLTLTVSLYKSLNDSLINTIMNVLNFTATLFSLLVLIEFFSGVSYMDMISTIFGLVLKKQDSLSVHGPLSNSNMSGAYLALCIPSFLYFDRKILLLPLFAALMILGSALSIATAIGMVLFYFLNMFIKSEVLFLSAFILMIIIYMVGIGDLDTHRFAIWDKAFTLIDLNFTGKGLGWFASIFPLTDFKLVWPARQVHNEFISIWLSFGWVGLILFLTLIIRSLSNNIYLSMGLFGAFLNFFGNFTLHVAPLFLICAFYYSASLSKRIENV